MRGRTFWRKREKKNYRRDRKFFEDGLAAADSSVSDGESGKPRVLHVGMSESLLRAVRGEEGTVAECVRSLCWQETLDRGK